RTATTTTATVANTQTKTMAVSGTLRLLFGWSLKPIVFRTSIVCLAQSVIVQLLGLREVLGLAWDCGAVTTGPVTVPVVIALGVGVAKSAGRGSGALNGFGIVTLASLFPVCLVLTLSMALRITEDPEELVRWCDGPPELPAGASKPGTPPRELTEVGGPPPPPPPHGRWEVLWWLCGTTPIYEALLATRALAPVTVFLVWLLRHVGESLPLVRVQRAGTAGASAADAAAAEGASPAGGAAAAAFVRECGVGPGLLASWCGLVLFNIGLTYGLTALGKQEGKWLPEEYAEVHGELPLHRQQLANLAASREEGCGAAFFLHSLGGDGKDPGEEMLQDARGNTKADFSLLGIEWRGVSSNQGGDSLGEQTSDQPKATHVQRPRGIGQRAAECAGLAQHARRLGREGASIRASVKAQAGEVRLGRREERRQSTDLSP
ncbi:unnamed protein product, partial [Prorocentrum cordatum]